MGKQGKDREMPVDTRNVKELSRLTKEEWNEYTKTVWQIANVSDPNHPAVFPEEIPSRLIKMFSFWGETILDPFAGTGTSGLAALKNGRNAICVDQNPRYVDQMTASFAAIDTCSTATAILGDARKLEQVSDSSVGLIVTSPPYWDKADYGGNHSNLGSITGYTDFIRQITPAFLECRRVLMPGRKIAVVTANVNQYTNHGLLTFPLATDYANVLRDLGFLMISEVIWNKNGTGGKWGSYGRQRPIFGSYPYPPNLLFKNVHEYILIFSKPQEAQKSGPKVRRYEELMELPLYENRHGET